MERIRLIDPLASFGRRNSVSAILCALLVIILFAYPLIFFEGSAIGQTVKAEQEAPIQYYYVLVPHDRVSDWLFEGKEPYFSYDRKKFEEITASSRTTGQNADQTLRQSALRSSELFGTLRESSFIEGTGVFRIRASVFSQNDSGHKTANHETANTDTVNSQSPRLSFTVPVDPIGFWLTQPTLANGEPISFGSDGIASFLKFEKSKLDENADYFPNTSTELEDVEVLFQWSLRSRKDAQGNSVFDLITPNAPQTVWNLKISDQWIPHITEGFLIEETEQNEENKQNNQNRQNGPKAGQLHFVRNLNTQNTNPRNGVGSLGTGSSFRNWKIFPGSCNRTVLTLVSSGSKHSFRSKLPIRQTITYDLKPEGLDVKSTIAITPERTASSGFSENGSSLRGRRTQVSSQNTSGNIAHSTATHSTQQSLSGTLHLDASLRLVSVYFGNQPLTPTLVPEGEESDSRQYYITIPEGEGRLTVNAFCPIREDQPWNLPRIRFQSQNFFWMETKCDLFVKEPLLISALEPIQATQTTSSDHPDSATNWKGNAYSFLYYTPDSQIAAELTLASPYIAAKTGSAVSWEEDRIKCTMSFDFFDLGQSSKLIELRVQPHWVIDEESIESYSKEELLFWEGDSTISSGPNRYAGSLFFETPEEPPQSGRSKSLFIYLKKPTRLKITGSRLVPESGELKLNELIPTRIHRPEKAGNAGKSGPGIFKETILGKHLIALSASFPNRLRPVEDTEQRLKSIALNDPVINECFFQNTAALENSAIYLYDSDSSTVRIKSEQRRLRFDSEIRCNLFLQDRELLKTYTFRCTPTENRIDVFHVHFSQKSDSPWDWTLLGSNRPLQCRPLSEEERKQWNFSAPLGGIVWEIQLPTPRSGMFEITATQSQSVDKPVAVPLPMIPESTSKVIELTIDSPYITAIDIINSKLKSIPIPAPPKNEYQSIRAAFRYDPHYDEDSLINPVLLLRPAGGNFYSPALFSQRAAATDFSATAPLRRNTEMDSLSTSKSASQTACAWMLQLDSQFEHNGVVREHATFYIENRGQKQTKITLPAHIPLENVLAVWIGEQRVTWNPSKALRQGLLRQSSHDSSHDLSQISLQKTENPLEMQLQVIREPAENSTSDSTCNSILLTLPKKQRFPLVSLEYWFLSKPLVEQKKLRPVYPVIDMPVLGKTWIAWTPPEFQTFVKEKQESSPFTSFEDIGNFKSFSGSGTGLVLKSDPMEKVRFLHSFDPFSHEDWNFFLPSTLRRKACLPIAERLLSILGSENQIRSMIPPSSAMRNMRFFNENEFFTSPESSRSGVDLLTSGTLSKTGPKFGSQSGSSAKEDGPTWGEFFAHPKTTAYIFGDSSSMGGPRIYCDWSALRRIGIFPTTPIRFSSETIPDMTESTALGNAVLENAGISILFYDERSLLITSTLNAVKHQRGLRPLVGERTRMILEGPIASRFRATLADQNPPYWIRLSAWNSRFQDRQHPWGNATPSAQVASGAIGWNAVEQRRSESASAIYIAHRPTFIALSRLAFLFIVLLSFCRPFSNPVFPLCSAFIFGGLAYFLSPYYAVIPTWAFWGSLCSLMFVLIRPEFSMDRQAVSPNPNDGSVAIQDDSTDAEYEVRELRPFGKTEAIRAKRSESFFDKLKSELSDEE